MGVGEEAGGGLGGRDRGAVTPPTPTPTLSRLGPGLGPHPLTQVKGEGVGGSRGREGREGEGGREVGVRREGRVWMARATGCR